MTAQPKVNLRKPDDPLRRLDDTSLTELARGIVTDKYLVADMADETWQSSLTLLVQGLKGVPPNVGLVVVPVAPHLKGYWANGNIPAVTLSVQFVPEEDLAALQAKIDVMSAVLWPDAPVGAPTDSPPAPPAASTGPPS